MPTYLAPGVYVEERSSGIKPIDAVSSSVAAFVGVASMGPIGRATLITSAAEFARVFGGPIRMIPGVQEFYLAYAVGHFFAQGGTKCYVVRVAHYNDVNNGASLQATRAGFTFGGATAAGVPVPSALRVEGKSPGVWAQDLEVQVLNGLKYNTRLAANTGTVAITSITLVDNEDVRPGDLLWLVDEASGIVDSVAAGAVSFQPGFTRGAAPFTGAIAAAVPVITPDLGLITSLTAGVTVPAAPTALTGVGLGSVSRSDTGQSLKRGDVVSFVLKQALLVVTKTVTVPGVPGMRVEFLLQTPGDFNPAFTRVCARDFTLRVRRRATTEILETHEHLSLVAANRVDHVDERLPRDGGPSALITAAEIPSAAPVLLANSVFTGLIGGNDGLTNLSDADYVGSEALHTGLSALDLVKDASILSVPGASAALSLQAIAYCERRKSLIFVVDPPSDPTTDIVTWRRTTLLSSSSYAALYYPRIQVREDQTGRLISVPPSGAVAGVFASTDVKRGVHKAPAGLEAYLGVASGLARGVTRGENDILYQQQINVIRKLTAGILVWGARTLSAAADPEWKYVNVRRLFIMIEQSIESGTQWVTFEPNDPTLWKSITRNVRAFLKIQWLEGKLVGKTESDAFFVKCDASTNPPEVVEAGQVITEIGIAPSKPAEFVVFRIRQKAGGATR